MGHTKASTHAFHIGIRVMITGNHHNVHHPAATSYLVAELCSVHARIVQVQNCAIQSSPVQSPGFTVTPFLLLIVIETFGIWSPQSLETLKIIGRKCSIMSSISFYRDQAKMDFRFQQVGLLLQATIRATC